jgi:hypothetical protein
MQCGACSVQDVSMIAQVLMNPVTWVVALAAITGALNIKKNPGKKVK